MTFITEIEKINPKVHLEVQMTTNSQDNTEQKEQCCRCHKPNFKLYYRTIAIKITWYWQKNRHKEQWNRREDSDMNPHCYAHLIFEKGSKNI
jgi:hypothetical protein